MRSHPVGRDWKWFDGAKEKWIYGWLKTMKEKKLYNIDWEQYLQPERQRGSGTQATIGWDSRNQFESDFGRVVFCPAIRRMHDKTQVIPLTSGDTILTRLTHSIQVMSVAESLAHYYTKSEAFIKLYGEKAYSYDASISAILRTAALLHDIGNPPFGHFGEITIQNYFKKYLEDHHIITERQALDFTQFDGNALGLRIVSKLQYHVNNAYYDALFKKDVVDKIEVEKVGGRNSMTKDIGSVVIKFWMMFHMLEDCYNVASLKAE